MVYIFLNNTKIPGYYFILSGQDKVREVVACEMSMQSMTSEPGALWAWAGGSHTWLPLLPLAL
jgi:ectoine hydroxylase-related dioxygenase (phytanoyl-CoA dioxygenase family)